MSQATRRAPARARTLTEALHQLDQDGLTALLRARPDLSYPLPVDFADLASRAGTTTSIARALDQLNVWLRQVAEGLAALPDPSSTAELARLLGADRAAAAAAVVELRERALLWGSDAQIHLVRGVREHFEPYPGGLAPPSPRPLTEPQIAAALSACDESVHPLLERLLWSPTGAVRNAERTVDPAAARSPVEQLLSRQLLRPLDVDTVLLPREVSLHLRQGRFSVEPVSVTPPVLTGRDRGVAMVDKAAAGAAFGLLHDVELVVHALEDSPHRLLRTGGLGTRDMSALARDLGTDLAAAAFVVECAAVAGLVAPGPGVRLLPTADYDRWATRDAASQWRTLVEAWLAGGRHYSRSAQPGAHVLGPEADAPAAPVLRRLVLRLAVTAGAGTVVELDRLVEAVAWHYPRATRFAPDLATLVRWTWTEAAGLGLTSLGAVSSYAAAVQTPEHALPTPLLDLFPAPVDRLIVQADLTAVAPGPLVHAVAGDLRLLADQESRGGGGVYRFSAASMRRAFQAGWSSTQVHDWLQRHSTTGVPQPLAYLVDDVARQHGSIRVGTAASYLRVEDAAQAAALLGAPEATALGLRAIAPGVLLSTAEPDELVAFVRDHGHSPAVEDDDGSTISTPPQPRAPRVAKDSVPQPLPPAEAAAAIVAVEGRRRQLRPAARSVNGAGAGLRADGASSTEETLRELQSARAQSAPLNVRYVAADGQPAEAELSPLDVAAGMMRAVDTANARVLNIPLARISSVWPVTGAN